MTPLSIDPGVVDEELQRSASSPFARVRRRCRRRFAARLVTVVAVAAGGVVGGCLRYAIDLAFPSRPAGVPWATLSVNLVGSFLLALLLVLILEVWPPYRLLRPFLAVGLLGSMTTFSTWMVEFGQRVAIGATGTAVSYLAVSLLAGVAATSLGLVLGHGVATRRIRTSTREEATE